MAKIGQIPSVVNDPMTNLDPGDYLFSVDGIKEDAHDDGRLIYVATFRVAQPGSHAGLLHYERFWIGSEEDPDAMQPDTWTKNAGRLKKLSEACSVPFLGQSPDIVVQQLQGKQFCAKIVHKAGNKPREDGTIPVFSNVQAYGIAGSMTPHALSSDNGASSAPAGQLAQTPAPAPMPAAAPAPAPVPGVGTGMPPVNVPQQPNTGAPAPAPLPQGAPQQYNQPQ